MGDDNLIMAYTHIAHDCPGGEPASSWERGHARRPRHRRRLGDGRGVVSRCIILCGLGRTLFIGGGTTITRDVLPFSKTSAERGTHAYGLNAVGLERRGFSKERIEKIHHAYRVLLASKLNTSQAIEKLKAEADGGEDVEMLIRFIEASERGVIK